MAMRDFGVLVGWTVRIEFVHALVMMSGICLRNWGDSDCSYYHHLQATGAAEKMIHRKFTYVEWNSA
jgi:hypothetical protein